MTQSFLPHATPRASISHLKTYVSYIFETLGQIQLGKNDSIYQDHHQESQDNQEYYPSRGVLDDYFPPMTQNIIFWEILGKMLFNRDDPKHLDHYQEDQDDQECPSS